MDAKHFPLTEATPKQLRWFAETVLQIEVSKNETGSSLINKILTTGWKEENPIFAPLKADKYPDQSDSAGAGRGRVFECEDWEGKGKTRECINILIPIQDPKLVGGGARKVPVGCNGTVIEIERGKPQEVPVEYVEILENAERLVYPEYDPEVDMMGGLGEPQIVKEIPFEYA
jgi:hypothetical protein